MKSPVKIFSVLLLFANTVFAGGPAEPESEKSKNISKSYAISSTDKVVLNNSFGDLRINTWTKNEVKVDISITVKANSDERAQKILNDISIEDGKNGPEIFFKTHIGDGKNNSDESNRAENTSFKINYIVYLPSTATLEAANSFGDLLIGDYDGAVSLTTNFGMLTAGKLSKPKKVNILFGKRTSVVEGMDGGSLRIGFSKARVNHLGGDVVADINQAGSVVIRLDSDLTKLDLKNNFGNIMIDAPKSLAAHFRIKTSFGNFSNKSSFTVSKTRGDDDEGDYRNDFTSYTYTGTAGAGTVPVTIKSNFGRITLGHDLVDVTSARNR